MVGFEWQGHIKPWDGVYGAVLFGMTGLHALHVLSGVVLILIVWNLGKKGHDSAERHWGVEATAIYLALCRRRLDLLLPRPLPRK